MVRLLHTMLRVKNIGETLEFYGKYFDVKEQSKLEKPSGKIIIFAGHGPQGNTTILEFSQKPGPFPSSETFDFVHIAFEVTDIHELFDRFRQDGVEIIKEPRIDLDEEWIGSVRDPNGYKVEAIQYL
jgi:lactoylglutathione lyase